jgi:hypothetical protein
MEAHGRRGTHHFLVALCCAFAALLLSAPVASAGVGEVSSGGQCPDIANKPNEIPHVDYAGVEHLTYCFGPLTITPGQNIINLRPAIDSLGNHLWPQEDGYITRFDPEFIYADGTVPRVDVLHLHHAVWLINGSPQFAAGEEKTIQQLPQGFGWPNHPANQAGCHTTPATAQCDSWVLNDMLHNLLQTPAQVYLVWRLDFVPKTATASYNSIKPVHTKWMDVAGDPSLYPVFDALRADGHNGTYTFPDQAPAADLGPCGAFGRRPGTHG